MMVGAGPQGGHTEWLTGQGRGLGLMFVVDARWVATGALGTRRCGELTARGGLLLVLPSPPLSCAACLKIKNAD